MAEPTRIALSSGTSAVAPEPAARQRPVSAEPTAQTRHVSVEQALETKGSVQFRKTPLSEVVFLLSELWHINIVAGENISGEVNGSFHETPLREVLTAALTATGYSYRQTGNSLIVLPADEVGVDNPEFDTQTVRLPPSLNNDEATLEAAKLLLSERGQLRKIGEGLVVDRRHAAADSACP